jgi:hypothetical protein
VVTTSPGSELESAIVAFRREQAAAYLRWLAGQPRDGRAEGRAGALLRAERGLELLEAAVDSGEVDPMHRAALCAHYARAVLEHRYARARFSVSSLLEREVSVEGETRALGDLLGEWSALTNTAQRERTLRAMSPALEGHATQLIEQRGEVDAAVAALFSELSPARHEDAGPEGGGLDVARAWLEQTDDLTREALAFARRALSGEVETGFDGLWLALGQPMRGLFSRDGRSRRLASEWEPLGLRRLLSARARSAPDHPGPFSSAHVITLAAPNDVRISPAAREYGLASELATAEAVGRAVGIVHGSAALPIGLRFASVGTVSRAIGSLAVQRFMAPRFLQKVRGLSRRESDVIARLAALYFLLDSRLAAAAVLVRRIDGPTALDEIAAHAERALLGSVQRGPAAALTLRVSPGGAMRGKVHGPALSWALRERFDEDWYLNPRAAEPLRGAMARAGEFSVEAFAHELSTEVPRGIEKIAELF